MTPEAQIPPPIPERIRTQVEIARSSPRVQKSANWFWWIAGLSIINSISAHAEGGMHFVVGLGFTELADAVFHRLQPIAYLVDVFAVGFFAGIGYFARKGYIWAFVVGGVFYVIDASIYAYFQDWLPVAFHAYALFSIYQGFAQLRALNAAAKAQVTVS